MGQKDTGGGGDRRGGERQCRGKGTRAGRGGRRGDTMAVREGHVGGEGQEKVTVDRRSEGRGGSGVGVGGGGGGGGTSCGVIWAGNVLTLTKLSAMTCRHTCRRR